MLSLLIYVHEYNAFYHWNPLKYIDNNQQCLSIGKHFYYYILYHIWYHLYQFDIAQIRLLFLYLLLRLFIFTYPKWIRWSLAQDYLSTSLLANLLIIISYDYYTLNWHLVFTSSPSFIWAIVLFLTHSRKICSWVIYVITLISTPIYICIIGVKS